MSPSRMDRIRAMTVTRPVVHPGEDAADRLASSLRRLGADEKTVAAVTAPRKRD